MFCTSCDTLLQSGTKICPSCGATVATQSEVDPYDDYVPFVEEHVATQVLAVPVPKTALPASPAPVELPVQLIDEQPAPKRQPWLLVNLMLFCLLVLLVVGESTGLLAYEHNFRSNTLPAQATQTARNLVTTQAEKTAIAGTQATATATAMNPQQLYAWATSGTPVIDDPLDKHEGTALIETDIKTSSCRFQGAAYHIHIPISTSLSCTVPGSFFRDLVFQIQITIVQGGTGGIFLRSSSNANAYLAYITADGAYALSVVKNEQQNILKAGNFAQSGTGGGSPHLLTVIARGSTLYLYLDKVFIDQSIDTTSTEGQVGLLAASDQKPADIAFQNVKIWEI
jgi:hypothetical protein